MWVFIRLPTNFEKFYKFQNDFERSYKSCGAVPHETALSHMREWFVPQRLFCPKWDCFVQHEAAMSHTRPLSPTCSVPWPMASRNTSLSHIRLICLTIMTYLSQMRLVWPTWYCSVPHETDLSHMILFCPTWGTMSHMRLLCTTWDYSVPHETTLSHTRLLSLTWDWSVPHDTALSHMRLICPRWDWSVSHETAMSHLILFCPTWDWSVPHEIVLPNMRHYVPHETALSHTRLHCPTWDWSVPHDITTTLFWRAQRFVFPSFFIFTFLGLKWGTGLGQRQDWDNLRTAFLKKSKIAYLVYIPHFRLNFLVWQCSSVSSTAVFRSGDPGSNPAEGKVLFSKGTWNLAWKYGLVRK